MKTTTRILGVSAIAVACAIASVPANATNQAQGQNQTQGQGQFQGQGQGQGQNQNSYNQNSNRNDNRNSNSNRNSNRNDVNNRNANYNGDYNDNKDNFEFDQKFEAAASQGALALGQGHSTASMIGRNCIVANGDTQSWGIGGSGNSVPGTGQGLFNRYTSEPLASVTCFFSNDSAYFRKMGMVKEAHYSDCAIKTRRLALEFASPGTCNGAPVVAKLTILPETETLEEALSFPIAAVAVSPAPAPTPVAATPAPAPVSTAVASRGNDGVVRCTYGFNYSTGQCATSQL